MANNLINAELPRLEPSALLTFYVIDASTLGGGIFRFYTGTAAMQSVIVWQGNEYTPMPLECRGFQYNGQGSPPRPSMIIGNVGGAISALCINYNDLIGARLIRKRTYFKFLDGEAGADPTQQFPDDIFSIEQKAQETRSVVEFDLATSMEVDDASVPKRQFYATICGWLYRRDGCFFSGDTVIADSNDNVPGIGLTNKGLWSAATVYHVGDFVYLTAAEGRSYFWCYADGGTGISGIAAAPSNSSFWHADQCSKRIKGCTLRFAGDPAGLPFGGYPFADRQS